MSLSTEQQRAYDAIFKWAAKPDKWNFILKGFAGCVDAETEYLTPQGWKKISNFSEGDSVLQWSPDGETEFVKPEFIKEPCDDLLHIKNKTTNMVLSANHRMPYISSKGNHNVKTVAELINQSVVKIPRSFRCPDVEGLNVSDAMIRVLIMHSADGHMPNVENGRTWVNVKKENKKARVGKLLDDAGIKYTVQKSGVDYKRFYYYAPQQIRTKDLSMLWGCNQQQLEVVADECIQWDGSITQRKNVKTKRFTGNKNNVDLIQYALSCCSGKYCSITKDNREYVNGDIFSVSQSQRNLSTLEFFNNKTTVSDFKTVDGYQYCFTTSSSFWLARRDGKIFPTGNSGKTHLLGEIISNYQGNDVYCCAPTAKAASVLMGKLQGVPVTTIHALLYRPVAKDVSELDEAKEKLEQNPDSNRAKAEYKKAVKEFKANQVSFHLDVQELLGSNSLIIVDEASMVNNNIYTDLMNLGCRVLFVGDDGQLPPVKSGDWFQESEPDARLIEIHRQALESPIIRLSMSIREGRLNASQYTTGDCRIVKKPQVKTSELVKCDQIITGSNDQRHKLNRLIRHKLKREGESPVNGDKLICVKNDMREHDIFVNGEQATATSEARIVDELRGYLDIDYGGDPRTVMYYRYHTELNYGGGVESLDWRETSELKQFDYAYAVTCHKSQGSEWDNVIVVDDKIQAHNKPFRKRWLYTAVTRAKQQLTLVQ